MGWFIIQKPSPNFDFCTCLSKKVVKCDSSEMQGHFPHFKGHFNRFEAISADSKPQKCLINGLFGKTSGFDGLIFKFKEFF